MTTSGPTPKDLETIAAFVDQRLSGDERQAFMRRLDADEALYEVFVETVRCREEAAEEEEGAEVVYHPSSWRTWALPAAAALAAGLAVAVLVTDRPGQSSMVTALVADGRLETRLEGDWLTKNWSQQRGISPVGKPADAAFRIGVRVVDLEVALRSERRPAAVTLTQRLQFALEAIPFSQPVRIAYRQLQEELGSTDVPTATWVEQSRSAEEAARISMVEHEVFFDLGRWTEIGELAALSSNRELLASRGFRRELDKLKVANVTEGVRADLEELADLLTARSRDLDLAAIGERFGSIIDQS